jgi:hypothetical protein
VRAPLAEIASAAAGLRTPVITIIGDVVDVRIFPGAGHST